MPEVRCFAEVDPKDALIIVAFPSTGAASPIAAQYLVQKLDMPLVGEVFEDGFEGLVHVQDGFPTSPVRIHGGDVACEVDGPCRRTYIISTEIPLPLAASVDIAKALLSWAKDARLVLSLDAVVRDRDDDTPDVFHIATGAKAAQSLAATQAPPLPQAVISGVTAALVAEARQAMVPAGALVVEASKDHPDGRAAAALITALDPLIPQIPIDAEPLLQDAMALEKHIRQAVEEAESAQRPRRPGHTFI